MASSKIVLTALMLKSRNWLKVPQRVSLAGMGLFLVQIPLEYSKKSSPGLTDKFMLARSINFVGLS